jgi:cysteine desulfurase
MQGLQDNLKDIIINSPMEAGTEAGMCCPSLLNVTFMGTRGEVLLHTLEQDGIFVSTGSACSSNKKGQSHVLKAMGLKDKEIEGTLRFSLGRFNSMEEMDTVIERVSAAVKRFRKLGSFR